MRGCTEVATLLNSQMDAETGYDVYNATVIKGVSWHNTVAATVSTSGLLAANQYIVRIPADADFGGKSYVDPIAYKTADPSACFTLQRGDLLVKGIIGETNNIKLSSIQERCAEGFTVLSVTDNRSAPNAQHWKVVGK